MGDAFPEIKAQEHLAHNVIKEEEHSFLKTLEQGLVLLDNIMNNAGSKTISGRKVFELKDTYGFPEDLTELILRERDLSYDKEEFKKLLEEQKSEVSDNYYKNVSEWIQEKLDSYN